VNFRELGNDRPGQLSGDLRQHPSRKEDKQWESRLRAAHERWSARCNSNNREMLLEANWHLPSLPEAALSDKVVLPEEDAFMNTDSFEPKHITLGFIGLGNMGSRIVRRLLSSGYKTSIYSRRPRYTEVLEKEGATWAASVAELAQKSNVILSCVTDDDAVRSVYTGPEGALRHAKPGTVVLEMSTISPDTSREIARLGTEVGAHVLDVPISGSTLAAERGELILFVGGNPNVFEAVRPVFRAFAKGFFHIGPSGAGTTMKLVVNAILGIEMQAIAEAAALGERAGLNRRILLDVLSQTAVIAPAHLGKLGRAAIDEYCPQFPLRLMNKDFRLIVDMARKEDAHIPATEAAFEVSNSALHTEGDQDFSAVVRFMEALNEESRVARAVLDGFGQVTRQIPR
jgi:3-hydroxyisobutyrate dehydrogenase